MESTESDSFSSATNCSDLFSPQSLPRPRTEDRESISEIRREIGTGEYFLKPNDGSRAKSTVWAEFQEVFAKVTDKFTGALCCKRSVVMQNTSAVKRKKVRFTTLLCFHDGG